jgi:hypothetical protein
MGHLDERLILTGDLSEVCFLSFRNGKAAARIVLNKQTDYPGNYLKQTILRACKARWRRRISAMPTGRIR